jgi:hypothetical protein
MNLKPTALGLFVAACLIGVSHPYICANAASFFFSTGDPDGLIATASRPSSPGKLEIETGYDFALQGTTQINSATFTGLLPLGSTATNITNVGVQIYQVFHRSDSAASRAAPMKC